MQKQQVLILRHSDSTPAGTTLQWLIENNFTYHLHFFGKDQSSLNIDQFQGMIILGGPQNVDEDSLYPWLKQERLWIEQALKLKLPMLGLCLGGQLIAQVMGAKVGKSQEYECGWQQVALDPQTSPLLQFSPTQMKVFQWHGYQFQTPSGAKRFAWNEITPNQGFIYQDRVIGVQFHPESTKEWIIECAYDKDYPAGRFCQPREQILSQLHEQIPMQEWYFTLLKNLFISRH